MAKDETKRKVEVYHEVGKWEHSEALKAALEGMRASTFSKLEWIAVKKDEFIYREVNKLFPGIDFLEILLKLRTGEIKLGSYNDHNVKEYFLLHYGTRVGSTMIVDFTNSENMITYKE